MQSLFYYVRPENADSFFELIKNDNRNYKITLVSCMREIAKNDPTITIYVDNIPISRKKKKTTLKEYLISIGYMCQIIEVQLK